MLSPAEQGSDGYLGLYGPKTKPQYEATHLKGLGPQEGPAASWVASGVRHASERQGAMTSTAQEEQRSFSSASLQPSRFTPLYGRCTQAPACRCMVQNGCPGAI